jgi:hypothetical protein
MIAPSTLVGDSVPRRLLTSRSETICRYDRSWHLGNLLLAGSAGCGWPLTGKELPQFERQALLEAYGAVL